ncbi:MAG: FAD-dependent monooxygenase, partial [Thermoplasmata archaeon]|nr:FAD-dependent monooxygenase [Thermoplasmata archaeon]
MHERVSVVIVGAGPAGIAAGMFLKRAGVEPLLLEKREPGGLLREANLVENYPGFPGGISGRELASLMTHQMEKLGVRLEKRTVTKV